MKKLLAVPVLSLMLTLALLSPPGAQAKDWSLEMNLAYNSRYLWRGMVATDGPVLQPAATLGYRGFTAGVWGNLELTGVNGQKGSFTEVDLWAEYSRTWGVLSPKVGVIHYHFPPDGGADTTELYLGLGLAVPLSPSLTIYYDVDQVQGFYVAAGLGHSLDLFKNGMLSASLELSATIGWASAAFNRGYLGVDKSAINHVLLSVGVPIAIGQRLTITPTVNYSVVPDGDLRDAAGEPDNFFAGVSVVFTL